jgi:hypothetical protein
VGLHTPRFYSRTPTLFAASLNPHPVSKPVSPPCLVSFFVLYGQGLWGIVQSFLGHPFKHALARRPKTTPGFDLTATTHQPCCLVAFDSLPLLHHFVRHLLPKLKRSFLEASLVGRPPDCRRLFSVSVSVHSWVKLHKKNSSTRCPRISGVHFALLSILPSSLKTSADDLQKRWLCLPLSRVRTRTGHISPSISIPSSDAQTRTHPTLKAASAKLSY